MENFVNETDNNLQIDVESAVSCLLKAIDIYTDMGRFTMAAKHHQSIAEMYESDPGTLVGYTIYFTKQLIVLLSLYVY